MMSPKHEADKPGANDFGVFIAEDPQLLPRRGDKSFDRKRNHQPKDKTMNDRNTETQTHTRHKDDVAREPGASPMFPHGTDPIVEAISGQTAVLTTELGAINRCVNELHAASTGGAVPSKGSAFQTAALYDELLRQKKNSTKAINSAITLGVASLGAGAATAFVNWLFLRAARKASAVDAAMPAGIPGLKK
jgi:hypothetical protein